MSALYLALHITLATIGLTAIILTYPRHERGN